MSWIFVDVEATGISPASGVMTEFGAVEFKSRAPFHGVLWHSEPDPEIPAKPRIIGGPAADEHKVMGDFADWLTKISSKGRPIFMSDNPAYDFQWINYYFDKTLGHNPFGHSGRRISDFWAGLQRDFGNTQKWKRYRVTPHDHNPVNDAMGNVEAFAHMLRIASGETVAVKIWAEMVGLGKPTKGSPTVAQIQAALERALEGYQGHDYGAAS